MKNESISLLSNLKERTVFLLSIFAVLSFNLLYHYIDYQNFKKEEIIRTRAQVVNIYSKERFDVLKLQTRTYFFFTSVPNDLKIKREDILSLVVLTNRIKFVDFLKGFYSHTLLHKKIDTAQSSNNLHSLIKMQHNNSKLQELFSALFLAKPLSSGLRDFFANLGISHLIAISGFHLAVLSFCLYFILHLLYAPIHQKYYPYRNKRFDILIVTACCLFAYVLLTGVVPSLFRAFIMFVLGFYFLRCNIKLLSFDTLFMTLLIILALFPSFIFSLSLWFSVIGVFYIFLFLHYFQNLPKVWMLLFFNVWIFAGFNPIVHFFFANTSYEQLLSPLLTLLFTLFYPLELFIHFVGLGFLLDEYLVKLLVYKINSFELYTPLWFFLVYVIISLLSIIKKEAFITLNFLLIGFNIYLYL